MSTPLRRLLGFLMILSAVSFSVQAEEEAVAPVQAQYYDLKPSFVANFGDEETKRLKFIKADVSVRAFTGEAIQAVMDHDALVRHQIVMTLSVQSEETLATSEGQESLRKLILEKVRGVLKEETGKEQIDDLLFTSFVVQR